MAEDDSYYREIGQDLHDFIRPLVTDVLIRDVGPVLDMPVIERIAREQVASLCGLVLRRLQDAEAKAHVALYGGPGEEMRAQRIILVDDLERIFGEALRDFSSDTGEPGK